MGDSGETIVRRTQNEESLKDTRVVPDIHVLESNSIGPNKVQNTWNR